MTLNSKKIKINGLDQQVYFWGDQNKPKLFLFHGWLDSAASFHFICEFLQENFFCIAPDLRGYGQSDHNSNPLGYFFFEYVADVYALVQEFAPHETINLLGHSLGGAVSTVYAGACPEKISKFINLEGFSFRKSYFKGPVQRIRDWLEGLGKQRFSQYKDQAEFIATLQQAFPSLDEAKASFLSEYLGRKNPQGYESSADPNHKLTEPYAFSPEYMDYFLAEIKAPCLFISASESEYRTTPADEQRGLPKRCQWETIEGCGHMMHHEKPEAIAKLIKDFIVGLK